MKICICDVCKHEKEVTLTEATCRIRIREGIQSVSIDLCEKHKDLPKQEQWTIKNYLEKIITRGISEIN